MGKEMITSDKSFKFRNCAVGALLHDIQVNSSTAIQKSSTAKRRKLSKKLFASLSLPHLIITAHERKGAQKVKLNRLCLPHMCTSIKLRDILVVERVKLEMNLKYKFYSRLNWIKTLGKLKLTGNL